MLRIGKLTDYALLIMGHLAQSSVAVLSAASLADALHLTLPTVSKVLKMLSEADLVNSIRGVDGGYHLARPATAISIADVITAMEGEFAMTQCCEKINVCAINASCTMRDNWRTINHFIKNMLAKLSILDMLKPLALQSLLNTNTNININANINANVIAEVKAS